MPPRKKRVQSKKNDDPENSQSTPPKNVTKAESQPKKKDNQSNDSDTPTKNVTKSASQPKKKDNQSNDSDPSPKNVTKPASQPKKKDNQSNESDSPPKNVTKPASQPKKKASPSSQTNKSVVNRQKKKVVSPAKKKEKAPEVQEKKLRAPRKKVTMENYLEKCDELLAVLDEEVIRKQKSGEKGTRVFRSIRKTVRELKTVAPKLANTRRKTYSGEKRVSGLELKCEITEALADFMQIDRGTTPSRNDITNAICAYIRIRPDEERPQVLRWAYLNPGRKRNLQNPQDRMKIIPDEKLGKLLGYEQYKKDVEDGKVKETITNKKTRKRENVVVTDPSLKYYVVQRLIRDQIVGTFKMKKPSD